MSHTTAEKSNDSIFLTSYDPRWPEMAELEKKILRETLSSITCEIEHVGSTSIPNLGAKPVIDLMIGVASLAEAEKTIEPLEKIGYSFWSENSNKWHFFFVKGLPSLGGTGRSHHVHVVDRNHNFYLKQILFRNYLRENPKSAHDYFELKIKLSQKFHDDRDAYTNGKTEFVNSILAKAELGIKYES